MKSWGKNFISDAKGKSRSGWVKTEEARHGDLREASGVKDILNLASVSLILNIPTTKPNDC